MNVQQSYFKKALVMLMAVMMVFTMMPGMAWATNDSTDNDAETITVYITVSDRGNVALNKDGTAMAWMPVEVPANKGTASLNATLEALHEAYYEDGSSGYSTAETSIGETSEDTEKQVSIETFWGKNKTTRIFKGGKVLETDISEIVVTEGTYLLAAILVDGENQSDYYTQYKTGNFYDVNMAIGNTNSCAVKGYSLQKANTESIYPQAMPLDETNIQKGFIVNGVFKSISEMNNEVEINQKNELIFKKAGEYLFTVKGTVTNDGKECTIIPFPLKYVITEKPEISDIVLKQKNEEQTVIALEPEFSTDVFAYTMTLPDYAYSNAIRAEVKTGANCEDKNIIYRYSQGIHEGMTTAVDSPENLLPNNLSVSVIGKNAGADVTYSFTSKWIPTIRELSVNGAMDQSFNRDNHNYHVYVDETKLLELNLKATAYDSLGEEYGITINGANASQGKNTIDITTYDWAKQKTMPMEIKVTNKAGNSSTYTLTLEKTPRDEKPTIIYQPQNASYTLAEKTAEPLTITASASGKLAYQWYQNSVNSKEGATLIENAKDASYTPDITKEGTTYYYCKVTNTGAETNNVTESSIAEVQVEKDPAPTIQYKNPIPELTEAMADGNPVYTKDGRGYVYSIGDSATTLEVETNAELQGGTWSYQWQKADPTTEKLASGTTYINAIKSGKGTVISQAADNTYQPKTTAEDATCYGTWYACKATYTYKGREYTTVSEPVYVFVKAIEAKNLKITKEPSTSLKYNVGATKTAQLKITAKHLDDEGKTITVSKGYKDGTLSYQWFKNTKKSNTGGSSIASATKDAYTPPAEKTEGVVYYYCVVTSTFQKHTKSVTSKVVEIRFVNELVDPNAWEGIGTEDSPYLIKTENDLNKLAVYVTGSRVNFEGTYFKLANDIELSDSWKGIGAYDAQGGDKGAGMLPFSGVLDGDGHRITFPYKGNQLFNYVRNATVKNLKMKAPYIEGNGLVKVYGIDYGETGVYGDTIHVIDIDNVTIESGSSFRGAGFIGGYASGIDIIRITNCKAEAGVKIGWNAEKNEPANGSTGTFAGEFNGYIANCESAATVYGSDYVGGIVASKGQTMGPFEVINCKFTGELIATGNFVGGIAGGGYSGAVWGTESAPNTPCATIKNCLVTGKVCGADFVGGIVGGEEGVVQCWANGIGYIQNNLFAGMLQCSGSYKGGIAGYINSLNCYTNVDDNYYIGTAASKGIGGVKYVDTSYATPDKSDSSVIYFNTKQALPKIKSVVRKLHNRTDDPLGKDAEKLAKAVTESEIADGSVAAKLNSGEYGFKNWEQNSETGKPDISKKAVAYKLELSGDYKKEYYIGEDLDMSKAVFTLLWTDGNTTNVSLPEIDIEGYDKTTRSVQYLTASYNGFTVPFTVTVLVRPTIDVDNKITVTITILGDTDHGDADEKTGVHTLRDNNLSPWITSKTLTLDLNATVRDALNSAIKGSDITLIEEPYTQYGWYLQGMKKGTMELSEFTNGPSSGWMYTVNGTHPNVSGAEYFLSKGDNIVWHYTDDYTKKEGSDKWNTSGGGVVEEVKEVTTDIKTGITTAPTEVKVTEKANADGTKEKVAEVKVTADNQKEILKQAKANKSKEIILNVATKAVGDATKAEVTLDKSFIDSIVKDTDAKLTVKTPFGDKTYTQDELKALSEAATGTTVTITVEKAAEEPTEPTANVKALTAKLTPVARSAKTAKKNVKVTVSLDKQDKEILSQLKEAGYTVKYRFYRSTKKSAGYKHAVTKKTATYTNTSGQKGTKYFYKVQVRVYDEKGKLVAKTALKQCKYASRTWSK